MFCSIYYKLNVLEILTFWYPGCFLLPEITQKKSLVKVSSVLVLKMWSPFVFLPNHATFMLSYFPFSKPNSAIWLKTLIIPSSLSVIFFPGNWLSKCGPQTLKGTWALIQEVCEINYFHNTSKPFCLFYCVNICTNSAKARVNETLGI